uniref:UBX domain-containing protein 4 n=1 Tax=Plectus sambesii TaxID=2011161 RepID=A0A914WPL3_9BILA
MWFNGPITEAIGKAKSSKVILVVFVRHATPNDLSDRMESFWTDEEIASQCQNAGVVALKLSESSDAEQEARRKRNAAATQGDDASSTPITPSESARPSTPPLQQQFVNQAARSEEARIQCRFVDGTRLVHTFLPDDLLQDVITLINQDGRESGDFHLVQMYPRREFSAQELNQSLRDLGLAPSAVLVVMPESGRLAPSGGRSGSSDTASGGGVMGVLTALFVAITSPLFNIYHLLLTFLGFGNPNTPAVRAATQSNNANRSPRPPAGNVHRFRPDDDAERKDDDDDDDMGTYNGNSTQQL